MATLLCYAALLSYTFALPTPSSANSLISAIQTDPASTTVSECPVFDTSYRSTVEIVWSCLSVIFASSWMCVHPNVTGYRATVRQRLGERLKLFALAVFAPEFLAVFAFYQWKGCRQLHQKFRQRAHALNIPLQLDPEVPKVSGGCEDLLDPEDIADLSAYDDNEGLLASEGVGYSSGPIDHGLLPGRSRAPLKTDPSETTWTYTHAHFIQMGGIVLKGNHGNIGYEEPGRWGDEELRNFFALRLPQEAITDKSKAGALAKTLVVARVLWFLVQTIARASQGLPIALLEVASLAFIAFNLAMYLCWWDKPLDVEYPLEMPGTPDQSRGEELDVAMAILGLVGALDAVPIGMWTYSPQIKRYPSFYCVGKPVTGPTDDGDPDFAFTLILAFTSSCFGAFHAIGWHLPAPSQFEQKLWRISCLALILYPFLLLAIFLSLGLYATLISPRMGIKFDVVMGYMFILFATLSAIAYVGARLAILLLPFFQLRDLPPLVHRAVSWSRFISPI